MNKDDYTCRNCGEYSPYKTETVRLNFGVEIDEPHTKFRKSPLLCCEYSVILCEYCRTLIMNSIVSNISDDNRYEHKRDIQRAWGEGVA